MNEQKRFCKLIDTDLSKEELIEDTLNRMKERGEDVLPDSEQREIIRKLIEVAEIMEEAGITPENAKTLKSTYKDTLPKSVSSEVKKKLSECIDITERVARLIEFAISELKRKYKNILSEAELFETAKNYIEFAEIMGGNNWRIEEDKKHLFLLDFLNKLTKLTVFNERRESELYDEKLIDSTLKKLKRKYKNLLLEPNLYEVARKFIKIMKILKKTIIDLEKVDITSFWYEFVSELTDSVASYESRILNIFL